MGRPAGRKRETRTQHTLEPSEHTSAPSEHTSASSARLGHMLASWARTSEPRAHGYKSQECTPGQREGGRGSWSGSLSWCSTWSYETMKRSMKWGRLRGRLRPIRPWRESAWDKNIRLIVGKHSESEPQTGSVPFHFGGNGPHVESIPHERSNIREQSCAQRLSALKRLVQGADRSGFGGRGESTFFSFCINPAGNFAEFTSGGTKIWSKAGLTPDVSPPRPSNRER